MTLKSNLEKLESRLQKTKENQEQQMKRIQSEANIRTQEYVDKIGRIREERQKKEEDDKRDIILQMTKNKERIDELEKQKQDNLNKRKAHDMDKLEKNMQKKKEEDQECEAKTKHILDKLHKATENVEELKVK